MPEEPRRREQRRQTIRAAKAPLEAGQAAADRAKGREGRQGKESAESGGPARRRMVKRLKDQRGKRQYRWRKELVEPAFGWVNHVLGFRQFSLRDLKKVQGEWSLVTLALNPRRMASMEAAAAPV